MITLDTEFLGRTLFQRREMHNGPYACASCAKDGNPDAFWYVYGAAQFNVLGVLCDKETAEEIVAVMNGAED